MEVFSKYFRRLLTGNAPQIFPGVNKSVENAGNYPLLVQEMQKVSQDIEQAQKIAETIDTSEGDIFRDFDLSTFLDHFKLDTISKVALALAFKTATKSDLRAKGMSFSPALHSLFSPLIIGLLLLLNNISRRYSFEFRDTVPSNIGNPFGVDKGPHDLVYRHHD